MNDFFGEEDEEEEEEEEVENNDVDRIGFSLLYLIRIRDLLLTPLSVSILPLIEEQNFAFMNEISNKMRSKFKSRFLDFGLELYPKHDVIKLIEAAKTLQMEVKDLCYAVTTELKQTNKQIVEIMEKNEKEINQAMEMIVV